MYALRFYETFATPYFSVHFTYGFYTYILFADIFKYLSACVRACVYTCSKHTPCNNYYPDTSPQRGYKALIVRIKREQSSLYALPSESAFFEGLLHLSLLFYKIT